MEVNGYFPKMIWQILTLSSEALQVTAATEHGSVAGEQYRSDFRVFTTLNGSVHKFGDHFHID